MQSSINCVKCGKKLSPSFVKRKAMICDYCISKKRIHKEQSQEFLAEVFSKKWSANLFLKYIQYLLKLEMRYDTMCKLTRGARKVFCIAEKEFLVPNQITEEWIWNCIEKVNAKVIKRSLITFLEKERLLKIDNDKPLIDSIGRLVESVPKEFRRLLEVYVNEKMQYRNRQIKLNARNELKILTIKADVESFTRCVKFIVEFKPHIFSWEMIQQDDIYDFLLALTPKNREVVRKSLLVLFKLAKRKNFVTHVPILDIKSRELPPTNIPLTMDEQKKVEKAIQLNMFQCPGDSLLASLCFYHGLGSSEIKCIKISDIDIDKKKINLKNRPPAYLLKDELRMLSSYLSERRGIKNVINKPYLFVSVSSGEIYRNNPVSTRFIRERVKNITDFSPKTLRITCFNIIAANFGPQLLVEGFGLSITQASRYGKLEDYLIEELIEEQRKHFK
ncbi:site-specific integrase [Bacillus thuringiensis]|uniref:Integrase n=3 Tax=Bacillus cereus group TaxID=86661 RepID=A0A9X6N1H9_BACTV|nr:integrase [Bacillus thuringiensis]MED1636267.1 site-specific integrase [Bacillus thuringiensis]MED2796189.1 site-specific integrase [Bacillus thuringiensis]OUB87499.1 integrase [Bacillus thuringiensis serovar medellin]